MKQVRNVFQSFCICFGKTLRFKICMCIINGFCFVDVIKTVCYLNILELVNGPNIKVECLF